VAWFVHVPPRTVPGWHQPRHLHTTEGSTILQSHRYGRNGSELPGTVQRSCQEAQDTFTEAHDCAVQTYGEGDKADRAAFTALKEKFEKRGDHWITK
jgi:hypothetical protein